MQDGKEWHTSELETLRNSMRELKSQGVGKYLKNEAKTKRNAKQDSINNALRNFKTIEGNFLKLEKK